MKKFIFTIISILAFLSIAKAQVIYKVENGITYRLTGVNGVQFNPDGSVNFLGGMVMIPATQEELVALGNYDPNNNNPPIKQLCTASSGWMPTSTGGQVWGAFFGNVCGPYQSFPNGPNPGYMCMNTNQWLCQAYFTTWGTVFVTNDCN